MSFKVALRSIAVILGVAIIAGGTAARSDLRNEPSITEGLIAVAIAYEVSERCDSIAARRMRGIQYLWTLEAEAEGLGYSSEEIDAFVGSRTEKDRLEAIARQRLREMGGVEGEWETYCAVGRAEIAKDSTIGQLLR